MQGIIKKNNIPGSQMEGMVASHFYLQVKSQDCLTVNVNETLRCTYT